MIEFAGIVILGILAQWFAWRLKIPAILPLIITGLLVGPIAQTYFTEDGHKWINPMWDGYKGLFPGESLYYFVSLAISVILFEGGLTLKKNEISKVGPVISKLITVGPIVTFLVGGLFTYYLFDLSLEVSFLFSSLIIVTGPTVITPILRNIPLKKDVSTVLKWEGILIDPIGALVAVLVFEFISVEGDAGFTQTAFIEFGKILLFGITFGFTFAHGFVVALNKKLIPDYLLNVATLSMVLLVFVISDAFSHDSGLLAVVVMGMVIGNKGVAKLDELMHFQESLSVLLISILFILLAANIEMADLLLIYNWKTLVLFFFVICVVRPLVVFLSSIKSSLGVGEKLFISWVGPRGIVAAGIASLFGSKLMSMGVEGAHYITPLVFIIVLGTVLLNATTATFISKITGVYLHKSRGVLVIGASSFARLMAEYLNSKKRHVVLVDNNQQNVRRARNIGLEAIQANIYSDDLEDNIELNDIGFMLALTSSKKVNNDAINRYSKRFGNHGAYKLLTNSEMNHTEDEGVFCVRKSLEELNIIAEQYPQIHEIEVNDADEVKHLYNLFGQSDKNALLFYKTQTDFIKAINNEEILNNINKGCKLIYLGRKIEKKSIRDISPAYN